MSGARGAVVVGAGVIGLTTAVRLLERGVPVRVLARERSPHTTSDVAAAIWYPYLAEPRSRVLPWSRATRETLLGLPPDAGVSQVRLLELFAHAAEEPWWRDALPSFGWAAAESLPPGYRSAYDIEVPLVEAPLHMRWLTGRLGALGGSVERADVRRLDEPLAEASVVVNCAGLEGGRLAGDPTVFPVRGQVVRLAPVPGVTTALVDEEGPLGITYIIPRSNDIVVGGTADGDRTDGEPDMQVAAAILRRAVVLEPQLADARVLGHAVGLRPVRPEVRVERDAAHRRIVHNYGHGGSGYTLAWGCADEAAELAIRALG